MTAMAERSAAVRLTVAPEDLRRRHHELLQRHGIELKLNDVVAAGRGISGLVEEASCLTANPMWLIDPRGRVVARSQQAHGSEFTPPEPGGLLAESGPVDLASPEPVLVLARPDHGIMRRHVLVPVAREGRLFAWLIVAEVSARLSGVDAYLAARTAFHLAGEYAVQRRIAGASWNARSTLARQLVRGSCRDDDLADAAEYLGVRVGADRVLVYIADTGGEERNEEEISGRVAWHLGVEVLAARGSEGAILLVEALETDAPVAFVHRVKEVMRRVITDLGEPDAIVGISAVTRPAGLQRCYRETREVVECVDRFAKGSARVVAVDDLGPARLFVANGDVGAVRRYVHDVLGALLGDGSGLTDLLRTLQCFFDTGRSVRESASRLGIHENTVRLRLAKIHDLTGLDVAADANDQLSAQTALLVLKLEGHPALSAFDERNGAGSRQWTA